MVWVHSWVCLTLLGSETGPERRSRSGPVRKPVVCSSVVSRHGEPATGGGLADLPERLQRGQQQQRGELQGQLPVLHAAAGRGPHGPAAGQDAEEDRVRRPLVLAGVLPPAHRQRGSQPDLTVSGTRAGSMLRGTVPDEDHAAWNRSRVKPRCVEPASCHGLLVSFSVFSPFKYQPRNTHIIRTKHRG